MRTSQESHGSVHVCGIPVDTFDVCERVCCGYSNMAMIMVVIARSLDCVVIRGTARALRHWMDRQGRPDCGSDGPYLSGRLVSFVL